MPTPTDVDWDIPVDDGAVVLAAVAGSIADGVVVSSDIVGGEFDNISLVCGISLLVGTVALSICKAVVCVVLVSVLEKLASMVLISVCKAVTWTMVVVVWSITEVEVTTVSISDRGTITRPIVSCTPPFRPRRPPFSQQPEDASAPSFSPQHQGPKKEPLI